MGFQAALLKTDWTGWAGAPGTTTMAIGDGVTFGGAPSSAGLTAAAAAVRTFFSSVSAKMPGGINFNWSGVANVVDSADGTVLSTVTYTPPAAVVIAGTAPYAGPAGCQVRWHTGFFLRGRELVGKSFLVPLLAGVYQADGGIVDTDLATLRTAATALVTASQAASNWNLAVWARPATSPPAPTPHTGTTAEVTSATVKDSVCVLRTRRS